MIDVRTTPAPIETVTPIKPSEAIRLGCLIAPVQAFDDVYVSADGERACVYGAMALGYGHRDDEADDFANRQHGTFPNLPCPADASHGEITAVHLNDEHRWSRERIADWLEGLGL